MQKTTGKMLIHRVGIGVTPFTIKAEISSIFNKHPLINLLNRDSITFLRMNENRKNILRHHAGYSIVDIHGKCTYKTLFKEASSLPWVTPFQYLISVAEALRILQQQKDCLNGTGGKNFFFTLRDEAVKDYLSDKIVTRDIVIGVFTKMQLDSPGVKNWKLDFYSVDDNHVIENPLDNQCTLITFGSF